MSLVAPENRKNPDYRVFYSKNKFSSFSKALGEYFGKQIKDLSSNLLWGLWRRKNISDELKFIYF